MAYNEYLAKRIRSAIAIFPEGFIEKKMFGGLAFLFHGKMTVGVIKEDLMVRIISEKMPQVLKMKNVRPMDFTKKALKEFIYVSPKGCETEAALQSWIEMGFEHAKNKLKDK